MATTLEAHRMTRIGEAIRSVCANATDGEQLFEAVAARLRDVVPSDGALWFGADPSTCMATFPVRLEGLEPEDCAAYWQREFLAEDVLPFRDLSRADQAVGTLRDAAGGLPDRSARFRELLAPQGYADELRAALRCGRSTWGFVALLRAPERPAFSPAEQAFVASISAPVAAALRRLAVAAACPSGSEPHGPGLIVFDRNGTLESLNEHARGWLGELPAGPLTRDGLPGQVASAVARARAVAEGREHGQSRLRLRSRSGCWLVVHASCLRLGDGSIGQTAVVIEPARAAEVAPLIVAAYDLSGREQEIVQLIARGGGTNDIASTLFLSPHTVRDHVKAIFEKAGVSSRGELVARVFAEQYGGGLVHRLAA